MKNYKIRLIDLKRNFLLQPHKSASKIAINKTTGEVETPISDEVLNNPRFKALLDANIISITEVKAKRSYKSRKVDANKEDEVVEPPETQESDD